MKSIMMRLALLGAFTIVALALFLPSTPLASKLPPFWTNNVPKIVLGLDLQGGTHLVLSVDQDKAVENHMNRLADSLDDIFKKKNIPYKNVQKDGPAGISIGYFDEKSRDAIKKAISGEMPVLGGERASDGKLSYTLLDSEVKRISEWATSQALETIRNRIDKFGVAEPLIQKQGAKEIAIQLPGLKDPDRAIELIGKTAVLEFRLIDDSMTPYRALSSVAPPDSEILYEHSASKQGGGEKAPYLVKKEVLLTGDSLTDARVAIDSRYNEPYVSLTFDANGSRIFERITTENTNKRLAVVLDGSVYSAPNIREPIAGGRAQITGGFTHEQASDLAIVLRAGALPAPVSVVQNVTVGPTLGMDSITAGVKSAVLGALLVLIFMAFYYKASGLIADFAIIINIVMLLGAMAWMNATLTLPGIAGIILTIGMGVDSNVLIFERIKEEFRSGRTPRSAVSAGYEHAFWTIIDSHITTLITAAVLFQFGSGPVKGFAVSLSIGIIINLFTSLVGTKVIFDLQSEKFHMKKLSI
ncbi:MAG: protein translocase subunit SecD [Deltaproteobacteria bacterium]|nr:protein translocase subunit SecD [Deltaproteobacteria bacterium]